MPEPGRHAGLAKLVDRLKALRGSSRALIAALLLLIFIGESLVMMAVEAWMPHPHPQWLEALVDAGLLTLICSPVIVWVVRRFARRSRLALRALDIASDGFWVADAQGRLLEVNAGYARMSGYSRGELLGMRINDLDAMETPEVTRSHIAQIMAQGFGRFDTRHRRRDGSVYDVHVTTAWLPDLKCFAVFVHDDSARVAAERAQVEQARHLQRLLDSTAEGIYGVDPQGRCTFINRAALQLLGHADADGEAALLGRPIHGLIHHHHADGRPYPEAECRIHQARAGAQALQVDGEVFWRRDGTAFPVACWTSPIVEHGQVRGAIVTFFDISEQQRSRAELQQARDERAAHRARTEFLSRMSHELRTPLNAVLGFSQMLRMDPDARLAAPQRNQVERIHQAGEHLLALVNDVLDLSRIEAGQMQVSLQAVNLASVVAESMVLLSGLAAGRAITLRAPVDAQAPRAGLPVVGASAAWVRADRVRLTQVLLNVLSNAIKYNRPGGEVTLDWQGDDAHCHLRIADNGPGMTPEQVAHLFEPFNRLGAAHSQVEGTGIGLVVAQGLMRLMQGELAIQSHSGQGTVVTLTLSGSAVREAGAPPGPTWRPSLHGPLDGGLRVMYVEDNEVNVEVLQAVVALRPGIALEAVASGTQALARARLDPPDLMLLDMNLGDMTGAELARSLRADPITAAIPLVAVSADALPQQIDAALALGFEAYLTKPVDFKALLRLLDEAAAR